MPEKRYFSAALIVATLAFLACPGCAVPESPKEAAVAAPTLPAADGITTRLERSSRTTLYNLEMIGTTTSPLASAEVMKNLIVASDQPVQIVGWIVDAPAKTVASGVEVAFDGIAYKAQYGALRPDVAKATKVPAYEKSGYAFTLPASVLKAGVHNVEVRAISADEKSYYPLGPVEFKVR